MTIVYSDVMLLFVYFFSILEKCTRRIVRSNFKSTLRY